MSMHELNTELEKLLMQMNKHNQSKVIKRLDEIKDDYGAKNIEKWQNRSNNKNSLLHELVERDMADVICHVIEKYKFDVNVRRASDGFTPYDLASQYINEKLCVLLKKLGAGGAEVERGSRWPTDEEKLKSMNIIWLDLEMTSIEEPEIMECAVIITDSDLTTLDKGNWVIHFDQPVMDKLGDWHQKTFADRKNGGNNLFADCLKSKLTKDQVEDELLTLIQRHCPPKMCSLAGSSIHIDKRVLELQMPKVHDYLHYRIIDVSSFQAIMKRWAPWLERKIKDQVVRNGSDTVNHRAMDDIIWSISYMREMRSWLNKLALIRNPILSASEDAKISVSHRSIVELTKEYKQATRIDSLPSTQPQKQSEEQIQYQNYSYRPFFSRGMEKSTISNQIIHSNTLSAESAACKTKACQVCFDEKPAASFTQRISRQCKHRERNICNTCIYEHIAQAFQKMCSDDVRCPVLNCTIILDYEAIKKILQDARNIDLLQRYERFYLEHQLEQMPEFIWCTHACGSGQLAEHGDQNNIIRCVKCRKKSCFIHRVHWHEGLTCAKYDEQIDSGKRATDQWLAQHTKNCPKCRYGIEKTTGCDHMTCTQCHFEFCWACLAAYADIRSDGNHRHYQHCKHFRAYPK